MKIKNIIIVATGLLLASGIARAAHVWEDSAGWWDSHWTAAPSALLYNANELNFDMFGSYINPEERFNRLFKQNIHKGSWGGGAGLTYFFTPQLGLGTDFNTSDVDGDWLVNYWVGNFYLRAPLGNSGLAPYVYGGGGRGIDAPRWQWLYGGGVGLEFRFTPMTGIFTDARFLWSHESTAENSLTIRAGLRLGF